MKLARTTAIVFGLALATITEASAFTINDLVRYASADEKEFVGIIIGAGRALEAVNGVMSDKGRPKLYCAPGNLAITGGQYVSILREYAKKNPKIGESDVNLIGYAMIIALRDTFPCLDQ